MKLKSFLTFAMAGMLLVGAGCATKPKTSSSEDGASSSASSGDLNFELNGDSDSNKAGGLKTVYFDFNSSQLTSDAKGVLSGNAEFLKANPSVKVQVEGHCDERGGVQYNLALGENRAKAVREYLSTMGVDSSRITTISYGKERPVAFGHDEEAWGQNRRGNFVVTAK